MVTALGPTPLGYGPEANAPTPTPNGPGAYAPGLRPWGLRPDAYSGGDHGTSTPLTSGASCSATRFSAFCVSAVTFLLLTSIRNFRLGAARRFGAPFFARRQAEKVVHKEFVFHAARERQGSCFFYLASHLFHCRCWICREDSSQSRPRKYGLLLLFR